MSETVNILASCRNIELLPATLMVFRTLRVGFPTSLVKVQINAMHPTARRAVTAAAQATGCQVLDTPVGHAIRHDEWVEKLFHSQKVPFWICDTDIAFFDSIEGHDLKGNFAGRYVPDFDDEWTGTRHAERLHTCLMWFDPKTAAHAMWAWACKLPESWMAPKLEFFRQAYWPQRDGKTLFHDTTAGLFHTIGGTCFREELNDKFEHLNCGTYSDLVAPSLKDAPDFASAHAAMPDHPELTRGIRRQQTAYYERRRPI